jgi:SWI/SNF-related matrix-associated actin-dependent regulator 1 of chromatin subfamily A
MIVPDSLFTREDIYEEIERFLDRGSVRTELGTDTTRILFIDEAHRFKNDESGRTRILLGHTSRAGVCTRAIVDLFDKVVYMSGTPIVNRPLELYPILSKSAHETIDFMSKEEFGLKFCAGRYNGFGYDFSGASNLQELAKRVHGTFMFRLKKDALRLPPITESIFIVSEDMPPELLRFEHSILRDYKPEDLMRGKLEVQYRYEDMPLMTYQRLLGLQKVHHAVEWIESALEESDEAILVFARHREVVTQIKEKLEAKKIIPIVITGDVSSDKRYDLVNEFQTDSAKRVMLGNLRAMGVGFNITKATRILNVEPDWTPATNQQGNDRSHRYGQTNPVFVEYLVYQNSVDKRVLDVILKKTKLIEQAMG